MFNQEVYKSCVEKLTKIHQIDQEEQIQNCIFTGIAWNQCLYDQQSTKNFLLFIRTIKDQNYNVEQKMIKYKNKLENLYQVQSNTQVDFSFVLHELQQITQLNEKIILDCVHIGAIMNESNYNESKVETCLQLFQQLQQSQYQFSKIKLLYTHQLQQLKNKKQKETGNIQIANVEILDDDECQSESSIVQVNSKVSQQNQINPQAIPQLKISIYDPQQNQKQSNQLIKQCTICQKQINDQNEKFTLINCQHNYHKSCIRQYLGLKGINKCCFQNCNQKITQNDLELLEQGQYMICRCGNQLLLNPNYEVIGCDQCNDFFCVKCKQPAHDGNCGDQQFYSTQQAHGIIKCQKCRTSIQKIGGCNHIKCNCGYEFCYGCGQGWRHGQTQCQCKQNRQQQIQQANYYNQQDQQIYQWREEQEQQRLKQFWNGQQQIICQDQIRQQELALEQITGKKNKIKFWDKMYRETKRVVDQGQDFLRGWKMVEARIKNDQQLH